MSGRGGEEEQIGGRKKGNITASSTGRGLIMQDGGNRDSTTGRDPGWAQAGSIRRNAEQEDLLKIRPGDKLREVTEMMKTQGVHLMTLTDTHLSQEGKGEGNKRKNTLEREEKGGGIYNVLDPTMKNIRGRYRGNV
eukprot:6179311-Pleurochrysis_carterae.AAC.3